MNERLPWHDGDFDALVRRAAGETLPHALLLSGPTGVGKYLFARRLAQALLCEHRTEAGDACGACRACTLFAAGTHPDYAELAPEGDSTVIKIDQVRELCADLALSSQFGGYKVAVIAPADRMNTNAANSLLKTLEEPTARTLLMLVSAVPARLPATVRSRCQQVLLKTPPGEEGRNWLGGRVGDADPDLLLSLADGAPLAALGMADPDLLSARRQLFDRWIQVGAGSADAMAVTEACIAPGAERSLGWISSWIMDMIRLKAGGAEPRVVNRDLARMLHSMAERSNLAALFEQLDVCLRARRLVSTPVNTQLLLDDLLIRWSGSVHE